MSYSKQAEARRDAQPEGEAPPPAYDETSDAVLGESFSTSAAAAAAATRNGSSSQAASPIDSPATQTLSQDAKTNPTLPLVSPSSSSQPGPSLDTRATSKSSSEAVPTIDSPFNFPSQPPAYTAALSPSSSITSRPIAIPQISALPTSPFLSAYAPLLLTYGITESSFVSFLSTISAFLTAKVSDRAVSHAGDVAKSMAEPHKNQFKGIFKHAKAVGKDIGQNTKKGNVVGAAMGVVGGAVTIPLFTVGGIIASAASLPGITIAAAVKKPKTPRQRAAAYIAVANKKWFAHRGLYAVLLDSLELAQILQVPVSSITADAVGKDPSVQGQLEVLEAHLERLEVKDRDAKLDLGNQTMWLVLSKAVVEEAEEASGNSA